MIITMYESPKYNSCIKIKSANRNYDQLEKINNLLILHNLEWSWLIHETKITKNIYKSYFSDQAKISLKSVELISLALINVISSPREIMNTVLPSLNKGTFFKLNLKEITETYAVSNGELILNCNLDKSIISLIKRDKAKCLRAETLISIFNFCVKISVPLESPLDLIYFPYWDESPLHFLKRQPINTYFLKSNYRMKFPNK